MIDYHHFYPPTMNGSRHWSPVTGNFMKEITVKHFAPSNGNAHATREAALPKVKSDPAQASGPNHLFTRSTGHEKTH